MVKAKTAPAIDFQEFVSFHGEIYWYSADCYPADVLKQLKKLKATTYTVRIGNTTTHYFTNAVPKKKDFFPDFNPAIADFDDKFWKGLRAYIRGQKRFIKDREVSKEINRLAKKTL